MNNGVHRVAANTKRGQNAEELPVAPLSLSEQRFILATPDAISCLMDYHDAQQCEADAIGAGCFGNKRRHAELKALGQSIIREDAGIWSDSVLKDFGFKPRAKAAQTFVDKLKVLQGVNAALQKDYAIGTPEWHWFETVDDGIHSKLTLLGD